MTTDPERERHFLDLIGANRPRLTRIARAYAGSDWSDLHQEILLQLWRGLNAFQGRSAPGTWLYRVALNTAMTWRRNVSPHANTVLQDTEAMPEPTGDLSPRDPLHVLDEFLGTLNPVDRGLLLLYLEDVTYADLAVITGLTESNVGVRLNRLKRAFTERYIGEPR